MTTTTMDADLDVLREAGEIIEEITEGKLKAKAEISVFLEVVISVRHDSGEETAFILETTKGKPVLEALRYNKDADLIDSRDFFYDGPWRNGRPRWTPEGVAGLVLATIGLWADPKNTARAE